MQLTYYFKTDIFINNKFADWLKSFKTAKFIGYAMGRKYPIISIKREEFNRKKNKIKIDNLIDAEGITREERNLLIPKIY